MYCLVEAIVLVDQLNGRSAASGGAAGGAEASAAAESAESGPLGPGVVSLDYGDAVGLRAALAEVLLADGARTVCLRRNNRRHLSMVHARACLPVAPPRQTPPRS